MTQTTGRFFDDMAKFMTDAAGAAQGVRQEFETAVRSQAERFLRGMDVPQREEFEAVKAMAQKALQENEMLKARITELEQASGKQGGSEQPPRETSPGAEPGLMV
jgi:BMFP domain-containing protein YqiC